MLSALLTSLQRLSNFEGKAVCGGLCGRGDGDLRATTAKALTGQGEAV